MKTTTTNIHSTETTSKVTALGPASKSAKDSLAIEWSGMHKGKSRGMRPMHSLTKSRSMMPIKGKNTSR
jgi:hypothetical protein